MPLDTSDAEIQALARRLAELTGESLNAAVKRAIQARLEQVENFNITGKRAEELDHIAQECAKLPKRDRRSADEIIGYDKYGVPTPSDAVTGLAKTVRGVAATTVEKTRGAALWSTRKVRDGATRVQQEANDAVSWSAETAREGTARVTEGAKDASTWSKTKVRDGTTLVTEQTKDMAGWSAERARDGAERLSAGAKSAAAWSAEKTRDGAARVADQAKDAAVWSKEKVQSGTNRVTPQAKDIAAWSAGKARDGGTRVAEGAKGAAAWSADKARGGLTAGLAITQSYGAPVITGVTGGILAVSEIVREAASFQKMLGVMRDPAPFWDAYGHLSRFSLNLDWSNLDPTKYLYAGTRGTSRGLVEAQRVWETIPEQIRAAGPEATAKYLEGKDWSHIQAYSEGGDHSASNGLFENASLNRARGSDRMTPRELEAAQQVLQSNAFHATLLETAKCAMEGALTAAAIAAVMAVLEYGLQYQRREITEDELYRAIGKSIMAAGISGAAVSGLLAAMAMAFPATVPVMTSLLVPLMVIGFSVLGLRLVRLGKGWYEVYLSEQPLRPLALQYWLADQARATANYVGALTRRRLAEEAGR